MRYMAVRTCTEDHMRMLVSTAQYAAMYIDQSGMTRANFTIYPSTHSSTLEATRSLLINTNLLTNDWKQIPIPHPDITAIELSGTYSKICLFNIYNDCKNNITLSHLSAYMTANPLTQSPTTPIHYVWLGDFNCHHPLWDKPQNSHLFTKHNLDLTQPLLNLLVRYNMKMALPPFTPTLTLRTHSTGNHMRVNNFFCSKDLLNTVTKCDTNDATCPIKTDHYPIVTVLDVHTPKVNHPPRFNFPVLYTPLSDLIRF